jgi:hypothetical protein
VAVKMPRVKKPKPQTELDLDKLQEVYLVDPHNLENFQEFFLLLKVYARSIALKEIKGKVYLDADRVEEVAVEATLKLLNQYKKEGWKVWGSFGGAIRWKVVEALYQDANEDITSSLNALIGDRDQKQELGDLFEKIGANPFLSYVAGDPQEEILAVDDITISEIKGVLLEASDILPYRLQILFHAYLLLQIRKPKARLKLPSFREHFLSTKDAEAFELLLLEVRNRLLSHY